MKIETAVMLSELEQAVLREALRAYRKELNEDINAAGDRVTFRDALEKELQVVGRLLERM